MRMAMVMMTRLTVMPLEEHYENRFCPTPWPQLQIQSWAGLGMEMGMVMMGFHSCRQKGIGSMYQKYQDHIT